MLMKVGEHTWGHNGGDDRTVVGGWGNAALEELRADGASRAGAFTRQLERAWTEQRSFVANAVRALPSGSMLRQSIEREFAVLAAPKTFDTAGFTNQTGIPANTSTGVGSVVCSALCSLLSALCSLFSTLPSILSTLLASQPASLSIQLSTFSFSLPPSLSPFSLSRSLSLAVCVRARTRVRFIVYSEFSVCVWRYCVLRVLHTA